MTQQLTPQEITKVAKQIIDTQNAKGYKAGWARYEMERRADKVEERLYACHTSAIDLGWACYYIAIGQQELEDLAESLETNWEIYQEMEERYQ